MTDLICAVEAVTHTEDMELKDTIKGMLSDDYKERFKAEYWQVRIRAKKLRTTIIKLMNNELDFNPKCSKDILEDQLRYMLAYESILKERAIYESINLD